MAKETSKWKDSKKKKKKKKLDSEKGIKIHEVKIDRTEGQKKKYKRNNNNM